MNINKVILNDYKDRELSIYATSEFLEDFICGNGIELSEDSDGIGIFDECSLGILSKGVFKDEEYWILEKLIKKDGVQYNNETDVLFVESDIFDIVDLDKVDFNELVGFGEYEEHEELSEDEHLDELLEEMTSDLIEELTDSDKCIHCLIKEYLTMMYEITEEKVTDDIMDKIESILRP